MARRRGVELGRLPRSCTPAARSKASHTIAGPSRPSQATHDSRLDERHFAPTRTLPRPGGAWTCDDSPPEDIAAAIAEETDRVVKYRDVEADGSTTAAKRIAHLL